MRTVPTDPAATTVRLQVEPHEMLNYRARSAALAALLVQVGDR